jgi:hypothetical protein
MIEMDYGDDDPAQLRAALQAMQAKVVLLQARVEELRAVCQLTRGYIAKTRGPQSLIDALTTALREDHHYER